MSSGTSVSQQEKMRRKHCTSSLELSLRGRGKLGKYHKLTANKKDFLSENIDAKNQRASKFRKRCVTFNESTPKRRHRTIADQEIIANSNSIIDHPRNRLAIKSPSSHQNSSQIDCESGHHCVFRAASSGCCDSDANELCDSDFPVSRATARRKLWGFSTPESGDRSAVAQTNPSSRFHRSPLPSSSTSSKQSRSLCSKHNSSRERDQRKPSSSSDSFDTLDEEDEVSDDDWNANEGWKKRKNVYFVSDGENRPTEMFRTDLVHRMKMDEQDAVNSIDEEDLVRMEDRWRQEWSKGVQVNQSKRVPNPVQEDHPCSSDIKETHRSAIKLTAKYNWTHFKKYVDHSVKPHKPPRKMHYQCDGQDLLYLKRLNELRVEMSLSPISEKLFGHLLDEFEVDCYMRIHHDLLSSLTEPREFAPCHAEYDEDACCDICRQPDFEADDAIVFCDGCNLSVHQSCYGIDNLPEDEWMCQVCLLTGYQTSPACVLCPVTGGAMKVTKRGQWAHIVCALWIPEVRFEDVNHREPITNISDIPDERWMFRCSVCDTKQGACIQCTVSNCSTAFHVSCAFRNNQVMRIEHESTNDDVVRLVSLCERHSRISRSPTKTSFVEVRDADDPRHPCDEVKRMESVFFLYISPLEVSNRAQVPLDIVEEVYEYWKMRRTANGNRAMLRGSSDIEIVSPISPMKISAPASVLLSRNKVIGSVMRSNLETVRNLCYLIQKREKQKKESQSAVREIVQNVIESLRSYAGVPLSVRTLDRFKEASEQVSSAPDWLKFSLEDGEGRECQAVEYLPSLMVDSVDGMKTPSKSYPDCTKSTDSFRSMSSPCLSGLILANRCNENTVTLRTRRPCG